MPRPAFPGGTVVQRLEGRTASIVTDLGEDAVNVSVSADGAVIAWETAGRMKVRVASAARRVFAGTQTLASKPTYGALPQVAFDLLEFLVQRDEFLVEDFLAR